MKYILTEIQMLRIIKKINEEKNSKIKYEEEILEDFVKKFIFKEYNFITGVTVSSTIVNKYTPGKQQLKYIVDLDYKGQNEDFHNDTISYDLKKEVESKIETLARFANIDEYYLEVLWGGFDPIDYGDYNW